MWLADITYVRTDEGFLHLAFILDACSRKKLVDWPMASHLLRTDLVVDALEMAVWRRKPGAELTHHTDRRGSQYTALPFGRRLEEVGIVPSMGRTGSALDNALAAESFVSTLKAALVDRHSTREVARAAIFFEYVEGFYNRARRHSSLGYLSPSNYETATMGEVGVE